MAFNKNSASVCELERIIVRNSSILHDFSPPTLPFPFWKALIHLDLMIEGRESIFRALVDLTSLYSLPRSDPSLRKGKLLKLIDIKGLLTDDGYLLMKANPFVNSIGH